MATSILKHFIRTQLLIMFVSPIRHERRRRSVKREYSRLHRETERKVLNPTKVTLKKGYSLMKRALS